MKKSLKIIITILSSLGILCLITMLYFNDRRNHVQNLVNTLYEEAHYLYFYGNNLQYEVDSYQNPISIYQNGEEYYHIVNFDQVFEQLFTKKFLVEVYQQLDIIEIDGKYFIKNRGHGLTGYAGVTIEIQNYRGHTIKAVAKTRFCKNAYQVGYSNECQNNEYYTIDYPFILKKENNIWKIDQYTSIFDIPDDSFQ